MATSTETGDDSNQLGGDDTISGDEDEYENGDDSNDFEGNDSGSVGEGQWLRGYYSSDIQQDLDQGTSADVVRMRYHSLTPGLEFDINERVKRLERRYLDYVDIQNNINTINLRTVKIANDVYDNNQSIENINDSIGDLQDDVDDLDSDVEAISGELSGTQEMLIDLRNIVTNRILKSGIIILGSLSILTTIWFVFEGSLASVIFGVLSILFILSYLTLKVNFEY